MAIFLDAHHGSDLPIDAVREFLRGARLGAVDSYGVRPLDLYCGEDGRVFYVIAAPDEAAVRQQHAASGVVCRRLRRVQSLGASDELGDSEKAIVRRMILAEESRSSITGTIGYDEWLRQVG